MDLTDLRQRLPDFIALTRLDRPIGIYLLMWPALWALWIAADGYPALSLILIFIFGSVLARSAGCVINDLADRDFDGQVERTRERPLAQQRISVKEALAVAAGIALLAFLLVLMTNLTTILLSVVALGLTTLYPFMKRYTYFPQLVLGAAFAWSVPMAFTAVTEAVPTSAWLIYIATLAWTMAYDTLYAMVDRDDDLRAGIKSTAILFGEADLMMVGVLNGLALLALVLLGNQLDFSGYWYAGLGIAALLMSWQLWHCRRRARQACFDAFLNNHWVGAAVFCGLFLHYTLR